MTPDEVQTAVRRAQAVRQQLPASGLDADAVAELATDALKLADEVSSLADYTDRLAADLDAERAKVEKLEAENERLRAPLYVVESDGRMYVTGEDFAAERLAHLGTVLAAVGELADIERYLESTSGWYEDVWSGMVAAERLANLMTALSWAGALTHAQQCSVPIPCNTHKRYRCAP